MNRRVGVGVKTVERRLGVHPADQANKQQTDYEYRSISLRGKEHPFSPPVMSEAGSPLVHVKPNRKYITARSLDTRKIRLISRAGSVWRKGLFAVFV